MQHSRFSPRQFAALSAVLLLVGLSTQSQAAEWSNTEIQYLHGGEFREPFNSENVTKDIMTLQHVSGYEWGRVFGFMDVLQSNGRDEHASEVYAEGYASFSLGKLNGGTRLNSFVSDINLTAGMNYGYKTYRDYGVNPRVLLAGVTIDFSLPHFDFFNLDILAYVDRGRFDGRDNGCHAETHQVTPAWKMPFKIGKARFSFEGFTDFIGKHSNCARQVLAQPQLRWDLGNYLNLEDKLYVGMEYQYWHNKFGIEGLKESLPQALLVWKF